MTLHVPITATTQAEMFARAGVVGRTFYGIDKPILLTEGEGSIVVDDGGGTLYFTGRPAHQVEVHISVLTVDRGLIDHAIQVNERMLYPITEEEFEAEKVTAAPPKSSLTQDDIHEAMRLGSTTRYSVFDTTAGAVELPCEVWEEHPLHPGVGNWVKVDRYASPDGHFINFFQPNSNSAFQFPREALVRWRRPMIENLTSYVEMTVRMGEIVPGDEIGDERGDWDPIIAVVPIGRPDNQHIRVDLHDDAGGGYITRPANSFTTIRRPA